MQEIIVEIGTPRVLKGYQNTTPECNGEGLLVGNNGEVYSVTDFQQLDYASIETLAIAHSRTHRYLGNSRMTVAQHICRGCDAFLLMGYPDLAYDFLFHEVAEPLGVGDVSTPTKRLLGDIIKKLETNIEMKLKDKFQFNYPFHPLIKTIDSSLAQDEMTMMANPHIHFDYWGIKKSYKNFMAMYEKLKLYKDQYNHKEIIK